MFQPIPPSMFQVHPVPKRMIPPVLCTLRIKAGIVCPVARCMSIFRDKTEVVFLTIFPADGADMQSNEVKRTQYLQVLFPSAGADLQSVPTKV